MGTTLTDGSLIYSNAEAEAATVPVDGGWTDIAGDALTDDTCLFSDAGAKAEVVAFPFFG